MTKIIILLFLISFQVMAFNVGPANMTTVDTGDILDVYVSEDGPEDVSELRNQRLGDQVYVLETDANNRVLKIIITKKKEANKEKEADDFIPVNYVNLKFNPETNFQLPSFYSLDSKMNYSLRQSLPYVGFGFLALFLLFIGRIIYRKIKIKRNHTKLKNELKAKVINAKTREEFEEVYKIRKDLLGFFELTNKDIKDFETVLNQYQYTQNWSEKDLDKVKTAVRKLQDSIRI